MGFRRTLIKDAMGIRLGGSFYPMRRRDSLRITEWHMQKAVSLLKENDKKLVEVAQSVGYESGPAFSKAFERLVGVTPGEYRQSAGALICWTPYKHFTQ